MLIPILIKNVIFVNPPNITMAIVNYEYVVPNFAKFSESLVIINPLFGNE